MKDDVNINSPDKRTILLDGSLTIQRIGELREKFSGLIAEGKGILIDHNSAEEFDFSYLQLLYSLYLTSKANKINFSINPGDTPLFNKIYKESGFDTTALAEVLQLP